MARSIVHEDTNELIELAQEIIAEAENIEPVDTDVPPIEPDREWSYSDLARFQLTGEYPEWYTPPTE